MRGILKIAAAFLSVSALFLTGTGCAENTHPKDLSNITGIQEQIHTLEEERSLLENQMETLGETLIPDPVCILCFDGAYPSVFEIAYPLLSQSGFTATVLVRADTLPGKEGMMRSDQAKTLADAGWEFIPAGSPEIPAALEDGSLNPAWLADLDASLQAFEGLNVGKPESYSFAPDCYAPIADSSLTEKGISVAIHCWSDASVRSEHLSAYKMDLFGGAVGNQPLWRVGGVKICAGTSAAQTDVLTACKEHAVISVYTGQLTDTVSTNRQNQDCNSEKYRTMLLDLAKYREKYGLQVTTPAGAIGYKRDFESDLEKRQADYSDYQTRVQSRIEEINDEISQLMRQMLIG